MKTRLNGRGLFIVQNVHGKRNNKTQPYGKARPRQRGEARGPLKKVDPRADTSVDENNDGGDRLLLSEKIYKGLGSRGGQGGVGTASPRRGQNDICWRLLGNSKIGRNIDTEKWSSTRDRRRGSRLVLSGDPICTRNAQNRGNKAGKGSLDAVERENHRGGR